MSNKVNKKNFSSFEEMGISLNRKPPVKEKAALMTATPADAKKKPTQKPNQDRTSKKHTPSMSKPKQHRTSPYHFPNNFGEELTDHINVNVYGNTRIGRMLDPARHVRIDYPLIGSFRSVHNLLAWLRDPKRNDSLREADAGAINALLTEEERKANVDSFGAIVILATVLKLKDKPDMVEEIRKLPKGIQVLSYRVVPESGLRVMSPYANKVCPLLQEVVTSIQEGREPEYDKFKSKASTYENFFLDKIIEIKPVVKETPKPKSNKVKLKEPKAKKTKEPRGMKSKSASDNDDFINRINHNYAPYNVTRLSHYESWTKEALVTAKDIFLELSGFGGFEDSKLIVLPLTSGKRTTELCFSNYWELANFIDSVRDVNLMRALVRKLVGDRIALCNNTAKAIETGTDTLVHKNMMLGIGMGEDTYTSENLRAYSANANAFLDSLDCVLLSDIGHVRVLRSITKVFGDKAVKAALSVVESVNIAKPYEFTPIAMSEEHLLVYNKQEAKRMKDAETRSNKKEIKSSNELGYRIGGDELVPVDMNEPDLGEFDEVMEKIDNSADLTPEQQAEVDAVDASHKAAIEASQEAQRLFVLDCNKTFNSGEERWTKLPIGINVEGGIAFILMETTWHLAHFLKIIQDEAKCKELVMYLLERNLANLKQMLVAEQQKEVKDVDLIKALEEGIGFSTKANVEISDLLEREGGYVDFLKMVEKDVTNRIGDVEGGLYVKAVELVDRHADKSKPFMLMSDLGEMVGLLNKDKTFETSADQAKHELQIFFEESCLDKTFVKLDMEAINIRRMQPDQEQVEFTGSVMIGGVAVPVSCHYVNKVIATMARNIVDGIDDRDVLLATLNLIKERDGEIIKEINSDPKVYDTLLHFVEHAKMSALQEMLNYALGVETRLDMVRRATFVEAVDVSLADPEYSAFLEDPSEAVERLKATEFPLEVEGEDSLLEGTSDKIFDRYNPLVSPLLTYRDKMLLSIPLYGKVAVLEFSHVFEIYTFLTHLTTYVNTNDYDHGQFHSFFSNALTQESYGDIVTEGFFESEDEIQSLKKALYEFYSNNVEVFNQVVRLTKRDGIQGYSLTHDGFYHSNLLPEVLDSPYSVATFLMNDHYFNHINPIAL